MRRQDPPQPDISKGRARADLRQRLGSAALTVVLALPLQAETVAPSDQRPAAIGRISYGVGHPAAGAAICTGTLVAPDLVLTARHCVEKAWQTPGTVLFEANATLGQSLASARGAEVILSSAEVTGMRANDVALLRLARPISPSLAPPLPLADPAEPPPDGDYAVFAYDRAAPDLPPAFKDCRDRGDLPGVLALSCPVVSGNSGAAVLIWTGEGWQIAAVMVASVNQGGARSLAALVPNDLKTLFPAPAPDAGLHAEGIK